MASDPNRQRELADLTLESDRPDAWERFVDAAERLFRLPEDDAAEIRERAKPKTAGEKKPKEAQ